MGIITTNHILGLDQDDNAAKFLEMLSHIHNWITAMKLSPVLRGQMTSDFHKEVQSLLIEAKLPVCVQVEDTNTLNAVTLYSVRIRFV